MEKMKRIAVCVLLVLLSASFAYAEVTVKKVSNSDGIIYYYVDSYGTDAPTSLKIIEQVGDWFD